MHSDVKAAWTMLALALVIDGALGEYPAVVHPVVWIGQAIRAGMRVAPASGWWRQVLFGALLTLLIVAFSAAFTALLLRCAALAPYLGILAGAVLLKASFALRELGRSAERILGALEGENLPEARQALRALCSRDPDKLSQDELLAAAIESLAENASDSFVAPLFYYVLLGIPGAMGYRAINTLDAMIGYHGKLEALGKVAAHLDDVANLVPARLTALLFLLTGWLAGGRTLQGWRSLRRDGAKTPSPNGGRPMAAMAGLLEVRLDKKGVYSLGDERAPLTPAKVRQAWRIVLAASGAMVIMCWVALLII